MNLRAKIRSDFPEVWANLALFPKEVFPDVGASASPSADDFSMLNDPANYMHLKFSNPTLPTLAPSASPKSPIRTPTPVSLTPLRSLPPKARGMYRGSPFSMSPPATPGVATDSHGAAAAPFSITPLSASSNSRQGLDASLSGFIYNPSSTAKLPTPSSWSPSPPAPPSSTPPQPLSADRQQAQEDRLRAPLSTFNVSALTPDDFPESRPLCNAPKALAPTAGRGRRGGRGGRGRGRGVRRWRGCGGSAGGWGSADVAGAGGESGGGEGGDADIGAEEDVSRGGTGGGAQVGLVLLGLTSSSTGATTLPTGPAVTRVSAARMKDIRAFEKQRDTQAERITRKRRNPDGLHDLVVFPPPPPGHEPLPAGPAALGGGRSSRVRRPPALFASEDYEYEPQVKRTRQGIQDAAAAKKASKSDGKRKAGEDNPHLEGAKR
ncbi:hypothetical protein B0H16DRAFT_1898622 [Mycena metata]|uniref:Uncharacterized protein n=1 Tax=Mycena metata TaxID=1033252 RepID=A0AAD7MGU3_9AGAR|nr:hypothetical protein B0H16DRAFT_1898622 [Mycena metata]